MDEYTREASDWRGSATMLCETIESGHLANLEANFAQDVLSPLRNFLRSVTYNCHEIFVAGKLVQGIREHNRWDEIIVVHERRHPCILNRGQSAQDRP